MGKEVVKSSVVFGLDQGDHKHFSDTDGDGEFINRVLNEPGFRFRLSELLTTYNIAKYFIDDLGYESRPFVEMKYLIEHLGLGHLTEQEKGRVAQAVLGASLEVRDDISTLLKQKTKRDRFSPPESYVATLPFSLQTVVLAKVCAGSGGSPIHSSELAADSQQRTLLEQYATTKLGLSENAAKAMLDAVAVIHGAAILSTHFSYGCESEKWHSLGDFPDEIVGKPALRIGYYLPDNIEEALRSVKDTNLWRIDYLNASHRPPDSEEENQKFINGMEWLGTKATELAGKPQAEAPFWRAYVTASILASEAFTGRSVSGYSGQYDQLASWQEPKPDDEYWGSYGKLLKRLEKYSAATSELAPEGVLLALKGCAIRIGHGVEQELIYGSKKDRGGRLRVLADIYSRVAAYSPEQIDELAASTPLIGEHVKELADRWRYRFS